MIIVAYMVLMSGLFFMTSTFLHAQSDNCPSGQYFDFATDSCVSDASSPSTGANAGLDNNTYYDCQGTTNADGSCNTPTSGGATVGPNTGNGSPGIGPNTGNGNPAIGPNTGNGAPPAGNAGTLKNPLGSKTDTIPKFLLSIIDVLLVFATPLIVIFIMYAGYLFVTAAGNSEQLSTARSALLWSIVGGVIVLGARVIIGVIQGTVEGLK